MSAIAATDNAAMKDFTGAIKTAGGSAPASKEDFLRLMTAQLRQQNPLNPMQDMDFTGQLAQLQALEEQVAMTKSMQTMRADAQLQSATSMIGKYVTGKGPDGGDVTGLVEKITQVDGQINVQLADGSTIPVGDISNVWNSAGSMLSEIGNSTALVGMYVETGVNPATNQSIQGIVQSVNVVNGALQLQLHGGKTIAMQDIVNFRKPYAEEELYYLPDDIRAKAEKARALQYLFVAGTDMDGGNAEGIVESAELDDETGDIYLTLFGGARINIDSLSDTPDPDNAPRQPTVDEMQKCLIGFWAGNNAAAGIIEDIRLEGEKPVLVLHTGETIAWSEKTILRSATDEEWAGYEAA
jgi:Flagellar hook capping protein